jgi:hypothetical protein
VGKSGCLAEIPPQRKFYGTADINAMPAQVRLKSIGKASGAVAGKSGKLLAAAFRFKAQNRCNSKGHNHDECGDYDGHLVSPASICLNVKTG